MNYISMAVGFVLATVITFGARAEPAAHRPAHPGGHHLIVRAER